MSCHSTPGYKLFYYLWQNLFVHQEQLIVILFLCQTHSSPSKNFIFFVFSFIALILFLSIKRCVCGVGLGGVRCRSRVWYNRDCACACGRYRGVRHTQWAVSAQLSPFLSDEAAASLPQEIRALQVGHSLSSEHI